METERCARVVLHNAYTMREGRVLDHGETLATTRSHTPGLMDVDDNRAPDLRCPERDLKKASKRTRKKESKRTRKRASKKKKKKEKTTTRKDNVKEQSKKPRIRNKAQTSASIAEPRVSKAGPQPTKRRSSSRQAAKRELEQRNKRNKEDGCPPCKNGRCEKRNVQMTRVGASQFTLGRECDECDTDLENASKFFHCVECGCDWCGEC